MFSFFKKKPVVLPEIGSIWQEKDRNPFDEYAVIRVLDVKANSSGKYFIQYSFTISDGMSIAGKYNTSLSYLQSNFSPLV